MLVFLPLTNISSLEFKEDFSDSSMISKSSGISFENGEAKLLHFSEINDSNTLLLSHFDSNLDILSPTLGQRGGYYNTSYYPGIFENSVYLSSSTELYFPSSGNIDKNAGTIDFWLSLPSWNNITNEQYILYYGHLLEIKVGTDERIHLYGCDYTTHVATKDISSFEDNSWHRFTFTWDKETGYLVSFVDGVLQNDGDESVTGARSTHNFPLKTCIGDSRIYFGNFPWGGAPLNGYLDELRIMNASYFHDSSKYQGLTTPRIIESSAFDTQIENPLWGNLSFDADIPQGTDIFFQVSVSDNGVDWSGWFDKPLYSLNVDDGKESNYWMYQKMKEYGFVGTAYIITRNIGSNGSLNLSQVKELQDYGWEVGSHTKTHAYLPFVSHEQMKSEVQESYDYLVENNLDKSKFLSFAYPGGNWNLSVINELSKYFKTARAVQPELISTYAGGYSMSLTTLDGDVNQIKNSLNKAKTNNEVVISIIHDVCDSGCDMKTSDFYDLMNYLNNSDIEVTTMEGIMNRMHSNPEGSQILHESKRYIKYRAILWSYNGSETPVLNELKISYSNPAQIPPTVACYSNIDCGIDGLISPLFCSPDNIVQDYLIYSCNNSGTLESYCSNLTIQKITETCNYGCNEGICLPEPTIACSSDLDCNDNNNYTQDSCLNSGTYESQCSYEPIICVKDSDCGFTGLINSFCSENSVFETNQIATCLNPGKTESSCSLQATPELIENCDDSNLYTLDSCSVIDEQAQCNHESVVCISDLDCNDNNEQTNDKCLNSGTIGSLCQNTLIPLGDSDLLAWFNFENYNQSGVYDNSLYNRFAVFGSQLSSSGVSQGKIGNGYSSNCIQSKTWDNSCSMVLTASDIQQLGSYPFTIEFWVKPEKTQKNTNYAGIIQKMNSDVNRVGWYVGYKSDLERIGVDVKNSSGCASYATTSGGLIPSDQWTHVVAVFNITEQKNTVSYYFNGIYKETDNLCSGSLSSNSIINLKNFYGYNSYPLNGTIDELKIWNRSLTQQEIAINYNLA